MGKQHDTFPDEQPEMPERKNEPEIKAPQDPNPQEIPQEDPAGEPEEFPDEGTHRTDSDPLK